MTDTAATPSKGRPSNGGKKVAKRGFFARIALFLRQVIGELRKVVTPTRSELVRFTITVLVFVAIVMLIVTVLDFVFGMGVGWIFGGSGPREN